MLPVLIVLMVVIQVVMPGTLGIVQVHPQPALHDPGAVRRGRRGQRPDRRPRAEPARVGGRQPVRRPGLRHAGDRAQEVVTPGAQILDDQWLGTLLEIGAIGVRRPAVAVLPCDPAPGAPARGPDRGPDGWLATPVRVAAGVDARAVHLRRLRLHPGDVPRLHHARGRAWSRPGRRRTDPGRRQTAMKRIGVAFPGDPEQALDVVGHPVGRHARPRGGGRRARRRSGPSRPGSCAPPRSTRSPSPTCARAASSARSRCAAAPPPGLRPRSPPSTRGQRPSGCARRGRSTASSRSAPATRSRPRCRSRRSRT